MGAFATASQQDAQRCKSKLETSTVANFIWGLARIQAKDARVMGPLGLVVAKCLRAQKHLQAKVDPQILAMLICSSAQLQMLSKCLVNTILKETRAKFNEFSPCSLLGTLWAFDDLRIQRLKLVQKVGVAVSRLIKQFD